MALDLRPGARDWARVQVRPYRLWPGRVIAGMTLDPPPGWRPDPSLPLDAAIPSGWDPDYVGDQPFQAVKFWRSAAQVATHHRRAPDPAALLILRALVERLDAFTERDGGAAFVVNRVPWTQDGVTLEPPWASAIVNAFAILGLVRAWEATGDAAMRHRIRPLAEAFRVVHVDGEPPPPRWISVLDTDGRLWFEEYPMPGGRADLVLNGHVYAVHALHEASRIWPEAGYDSLARAGASSVALTIRRFRRPGRKNLYTLRGPRKGGYLPHRTLRQMHELYALTGEVEFGWAAHRFAEDFARWVPPDLLRESAARGEALLEERRRWLGASEAGGLEAEARRVGSARRAPLRWPRRAAALWRRLRAGLSSARRR